MPLGKIQVAFPDSTFPGTDEHGQESSGRVINAYIEPLGPAAPGPAIFRRAPGLHTFGTTTRLGFRGAMEVNGLLYCAFNNRLVTMTSAGGPATDLGALTGSAKGFFARNNASPTPQKVFCDADGNYAKFEPPGTITMNYDTDLPAPNSVCSIDGYFVYTISDGRVFASDFQDTEVNALAYANAESKPDGLLRAVPWAGQLYLFGPFTTEVWQNAGTTPFPFQRVGVVIPRGLAGPFCVSGFEDNFSHTLVWVADDNTVVKLDGYSPTKISPPDLDGLIENVADKTTLELSCFISRGHAFLLLSSPTWSYVFDLNTQRWAERDSYLQSRSRITGGTVYAFGRWLCGDQLTGNVNEITNDSHTEPPRIQAVSGAVAGNNNAIRLTVENAFTVGPRVICKDIGGTGEANNFIWTTSVINQTHLELAGSNFINAYTTGGTIADADELPFRWRLESGAVENFPVGHRVGRADFSFVTGVGLVTNPHVQPVHFCGQDFSASTNKIWVVIDNTARLINGNAVKIEGVLGTTEANGTWPISVIVSNIIQLEGSDYVNGYVSGGTATLLPALEPSETDPVVEISWSDDGGTTWAAPIRRALGRQKQSKQLVSLIACTGRSSWNGRRWRIDISDPVYVGFMAASQSASPRVADNA